VSDQSVHFSSGKDDWETPHDLYAKLHKEFDFELDPCCNLQNRKCATFITTDGLSEHWLGKRVFCNPPYSNLKAWVRKCYGESLMHGSLCVMLIPARTDTKVWHSYIWDNLTHKPRTGVEVRLLPGRLRFVGAKASAPFPSAIIVFRPV
jgi:site-specific DNA-methyltransferase (adenine-specific)